MEIEHKLDAHTLLVGDGKFIGSQFTVTHLQVVTWIDGQDYDVTSVFDGKQLLAWCELLLEKSAPRMEDLRG